MTFNVKDINSKPEMTGKALLAASAAVLWGISAPVFADSRQDNDSDSVDLTEDVTRVSNLNSYKAVIFASTSRDALWNHSVGGQAGQNLTGNYQQDAARTALRQYMRAGGGFVAIHNAFGTEYNWQYYEGLLGNANYYDHGAFQTGVVQIINDRDVSTAGLPARWTFSDEWYNLVPFPTKVRFLALVDEDSLATKHSVHPGFPKFHPVAWCQYYDGGRAWVTTLGHINTAFTAGSPPSPAAGIPKNSVGGLPQAKGVGALCPPGRPGPAQYPDPHPPRGRPRGVG